MSTFTDDFNRADANPIDGDWASVASSAWQVVSNEAFANDGGGGLSVVRNTNAFASFEHESTITHTSNGGQNAYWMGPAVCMSNSAATYYAAEWTSNTLRIVKFVSGSRVTTFSSKSLTRTLPDTIRLVASDGGGGSVDLECFVNGVSQLTANDSSTPLTSNVYAGLQARSSSSNPQTGDDYTSTEPAAGGVVIPIFAHHYRQMAA